MDQSSESRRNTGSHRHVEHEIPDFAITVAERKTDRSLWPNLVLGGDRNRFAVNYMLGAVQTPSEHKNVKDTTASSSTAGDDPFKKSETLGKVTVTSSTIANRTNLKLRANGTVQLEMAVDSSQIVSLDRPIPRAQVNDHEIVELTAVTPEQLVVFAKQTGATQIRLFDEQGKMYVIDCVVKGNQQEGGQPGGSGGRITLPPYVIEPPDILLLTPIRLVPRDPVRIQPLETVYINAENTKYNAPIAGKFKVDSSGDVVLGPSYGTVKISGLTRREAQEAVKKQLQETLQDPEVALTLDESRVEKQIEGEHLVGPDGTINLGTYGQVRVDFDTVAEARKAIQDKLNAFFFEPEVAVDVYAYNSKVYYVILKRADQGDTIQRFPITGNETALDALAQMSGLAGLSEAKIWIARPDPKGENLQIEVDWDRAPKNGGAANPQVLPGDRIFIEGAHFKPDSPISANHYPTPAYSLKKAESSNDDATSNAFVKPLESPAAQHARDRVKTPPTFVEPPTPPR